MTTFQAVQAILADRAGHPELALVTDPAIYKANLGLVTALLVCTLLVATVCFGKIRGGIKKVQGIPEVFSLPWIGTLSLLSGLPHLVVSMLSQKYGQIFRLNAGGDRQFVILNDISDVRDAMRRFPSALTGKPQTTTTKLTNAGAQQDWGKRWGKRRHITMTAIKNIFRNAPETLKNVCTTELHQLVNKLRATAQAPCEPTQDVTTFVARTIWRLTYGRGQNPDDTTAAELETLATKIDDYTQNSGPFSILDRFPFLKKLISKSLGHYKDAVKFMNNFCEQNEQRRIVEERQGNQEAHNDIMGFIMQGGKSLTEEDKARLGLTEELLYKGVGDLVRAGTESPSLLLLWLCLMLANNQEVQDKMAAELSEHQLVEDDVIFDVTMERLPYTYAVVYETVRYCSIVPFLKRRTLDAVTVGKYDLPQGTDIIINNHAISHDVTRWGDPEVFRPARFITPEGDFDMNKLELFLPFGIGKRRCMGEELGKLLPFSAIATLVYNFNIVRPDKDQLSETPAFGITLTPPKHNLIFETRHKTDVFS